MDQELLDKAIALAARGYQVGVQREDDENGNHVWVAFVREMPSCFAQGDTAQDAIEALKTVREDYIYFLMKHGVPVPEPELQAPAGNRSRTEQADPQVLSAE